MDSKTYSASLFDVARNSWKEFIRGELMWGALAAVVTGLLALTISSNPLVAAVIGFVFFAVVVLLFRFFNSNKVLFEEQRATIARYAEIEREARFCEPDWTLENAVEYLVSNNHYKQETIACEKLSLAALERRIRVWSAKLDNDDFRLTPIAPEVFQTHTFALAKRENMAISALKKVKESEIDLNLVNPQFMRVEIISAWPRSAGEVLVENNGRE